MSIFKNGNHYTITYSIVSEINDEDSGDLKLSHLLHIEIALFLTFLQTKISRQCAIFFITNICLDIAHGLLTVPAVDLIGHSSKY